MKNIIKKVLFSSLIFLLYFYFSDILNLVLDFFNIDMSKWSYIFKIVFIYTIELIPLIALIFIYRKDLVSEFKDFKKNIVRYADKYIRYWVLGLFLMAISNSIISIFTKSAISNNEEAIRQIADMLPLYTFFTTSISAPLVEELAYRKTLNNVFINKWVSIIMGGVLFGLAHVLGTYTTLTDFLYIIPYGILGSIFMYIYVDSENIWSTISIHALHNTILIITYFISSNL